MSSHEYSRTYSQRRVSLNGELCKSRSRSNKKQKNNSIAGTIDMLFAEIDAIFGKKTKQSSQYRNNLKLKKNHASVYGDDLYDEVDLWLLRLNTTLESIKEALFETHKKYARKFQKLGSNLDFYFNQQTNTYPDDNIQALTVEIEEIFGRRLRRFGARVDLHQGFSKKNNLSAHDLRNELERLLKSDKPQIYHKEVA